MKTAPEKGVFIMYCKNCGTYLNDDAAYCSACGVPQTKDAPTYTEGEEKTPESEAQKSAAIGVLVWGILGLFFALEFPLLGLIFSCIARKKYTEYEHTYGKAKDVAAIGKGLAIAGFIVGLVCTILGALEVVSAFSAGFAAALAEIYPF